MLCGYCGLEFKSVTNTHVAQHGLTASEYRSAFGPMNSEYVKQRSRETHTEHGLTHRRWYQQWMSMMRRSGLINPNGLVDHYAVIGIKAHPDYCDPFRFFADLGECPFGFSLDRIDNSRGYEPGNCRWASRELQNQNRSCTRYLECEGHSMPLAEWVRVLGVAQPSLRRWLRRGETIAQIAQRLELL